MCSVGLDVSNGRSTVTMPDVDRKVVVKPHDVHHTADGFAKMIQTSEIVGGFCRCRSDQCRVQHRCFGQQAQQQSRFSLFEEDALRHHADPDPASTVK